MNPPPVSIPRSACVFRNLLSELSGERIVILSTHIVSDIEATATDIALISQGALVMHASPEDLLREVEGKVWEWVLPSTDLNAARQRYLIGNTTRRSDGAHARVLADTPPPGAQPVPPTLEDAYIFCLSRHRDVNRARVLYHMARADFLERVRRYSFLLTLVGNEYRGVYNSAWIGMLMTICCSTWLSLVGFYIVKNSIRRDSDTRVGQILAATPMPKAIYTLAKTLSNFAVLAFGSFGRRLFWLPAMLLTASLALLFETLPVLRSGVGNVLYFFLWIALLAMGGTGTWDDPSGLRLLYRSTRAALHVADSTNPSDFQFSLTIGGTHAARTFVWNGIDWTAQLLLNRLFWVAAAAGLALLASVFITRFDPTKEWFRRRSRSLATSPAAAASEDTTPRSFQWSQSPQLT